MKRAFLWTHRWFGILVGFYFVLLGLSGSFIVYRDTFQSWLAPGPRRAITSPAEQGNHQLNLASAVKEAQRGLKVDRPPSRIVVPADPQRNLEFYFSGIPGMGRTQLIAFVDPYTEEFRAQENPRDTLGGKIFVFHHDLFMGDLGRTIMGVSGFAMLFILISGLYLWWPRRISWRQALSLKKMRNAFQWNLELHKFFGFYTFVLMILVTFSGIYITRPGWFQTMPARKADAPPKENLPATPPFDFAKIQNWIESSAVPKPWSVRLNEKEFSLQLTDGAGAQSRIDLSRMASLPAPPLPAKTMLRVQRDIHGGNFWGITGEVLIFTSGILPVFFYVSGFYIWWKKRKRKIRPTPKLQGALS